MKFKLEHELDKIINKIIRSNFNPSEIEASYWDRHWEEHINFFENEKIPFEIKTIWWRNLYDEMLLHYKNLISDFKNKTICEMGSGSGYISLLMAKDGANISLIDFSKKSQDYTKLLALYLKISKSNLNFFTENIFSQLEIGQFDLVWNCGVIEHYPWMDALKLVKIMSKHTKVGGKVIITLPNLLSPELIYKMIKEGKGSEIFFSYRMLQTLMQEAGLVDVKTYPINYWAPSFLPHNLANCMRKINICRYIKYFAWLFTGIGTKEA